MFWKILWTPVSEKQLKISKCALLVFFSTLKDLRLWFPIFFRYLLRFLRYFERNILGKSLSGARRFKDALTRVKIHLKCLFYLEIESLSWTAQPGHYFPKIGGGGVFWDILYLCISETVGDENEHGSIRSFSTPSFFFFFFTSFCKLKGSFVLTYGFVKQNTIRLFWLDRSHFINIPPGSVF